MTLGALKINGRRFPNLEIDIKDLIIISSEQVKKLKKLKQQEPSY